MFISHIILAVLVYGRVINGTKECSEIIRFGIYLYLIVFQIEINNIFF
jgi:hypothetical protein